MTTAEQLRTEGEVEGHAKGRLQGRAEGRTEDLAEALLRLLTLKFGPVGPAAIAAVKYASAEQVATWTERILTADTLDDIFSES